MKATWIIELFSDLMICFIIYNMKIDCAWDTTRPRAIGDDGVIRANNC